MSLNDESSGTITTDARASGGTHNFNSPTTVGMRRSGARWWVFFWLALAVMCGPGTAWGQYASKAGDVVGAVGGTCSSSSITYGWPDTNGDVLKCVSNVWTLVTQPATAGGSNGHVQFNSSNALAGSASFFWDNTDLWLGIGTNVPDVILSLGGQSAQTIDMVRETTASTAGNNLTVSAGGAKSGGTDLAGGNLILSSGISTGTRTSTVQVQTYPAAGSTSSSDNTAATALTISETGAASSGHGTLATTIQGTAGSGTDKNGGTLTLASGVSTGTGSSSMSFNVYGAGSSGSTANSATTAITIASTGNVGIGTASPGVNLDVQKGIRAGSSSNVSTCGSGQANGEGTIRVNYTSHYLEYCNGTQWVELTQEGTTPSSSDGYFVLSKSTHNGNFGSTSDDLSKPDAWCLTELTTNTGWKNYSYANAYGKLTSSHVHAFLCTDVSCNALYPNTRYYFANGNDSSAGGAYFTTSEEGDYYGEQPQAVGPNDLADWSTSDHFNVTSQYYWTGYRNPDTDEQWSNAPTGTGYQCMTTYPWDTGTTAANAVTGLIDTNFGGNTGGSRWWLNNFTCDTLYPIVCYVNP